MTTVTRPRPCSRQAQPQSPDRAPTPWPVWLSHARPRARGPHKNSAGALLAGTHQSRDAGDLASAVSSLARSRRAHEFSRRLLSAPARCEDVRRPRSGFGSVLHGRSGGKHAIKSSGARHASQGDAKAVSGREAGSRVPVSWLRKAAGSRRRCAVLLAHRRRRSVSRIEVRQ